MAEQPWLEQFKHVSAKTYRQQAIFFLNAYWKERQSDVEDIWGYVEAMSELDEKNGKDGCDLDELKSHVFLEKQGGTMTVLELRNKLRKMDLDFNKRMAMIEFLLFKYDEDVKDLLKRPQGTDEALNKAQDALSTAQTEIEKIEGEKQNLIDESKKPGVKGNRAKNQLQQLLVADQTGLNRMILSAEAAVRTVKKSGTIEAAGLLWWIERELEEVRRYKPQSKGGRSK
uniref:Actin bundling protein n=1 Tax=Hirondellea gigas TaxID=1518452 RepID=A0A2P2I6M8_9CRUS